MKILYTSKGSKVYLDDDIAESIGARALYETGKGVSVSINGKTCSLGKFIDRQSKIVRRKDTSVYNYQRSNLITSSKLAVGEFGIIPYNGVGPVKVGNNTYAVAYYYIKGCKRVDLGYYYTPYDAAVVREYTIRKNNIHTKETNIDIEDSKLEEEYLRVINYTDETKQMNKDLRVKKFLELNNKSKLESETAGLCKKPGGRFGVYLRVGDTVESLGNYKSLTEAAIIRNAFIIKNNLNYKLYSLDIDIEEQVKLSSYIKTVVESREIGMKKKSKKGYKGLNEYKCKDGVGYRVIVRLGDKRVYIGSARNKEIAAMFYNIYTLDNKIARGIVNDVGLNIEEQRKIIEDNGYKFYDGRYRKIVMD